MSVFAIVLDPVDEYTSRRNGEVDLNGLGKIMGEPAAQLVSSGISLHDSARSTLTSSRQNYGAQMDLHRAGNLS